MALEQKLENIEGNLRDAYKQCVPGTMRHVDELMDERRIKPVTETGEDLRDLWFYTSDGQLYSGKEKTPLWVITREPQTPLLQRIDVYFDQLVSEGNYCPAIEEFQAAKDNKDSVLIDLTQLRLQEGSQEYGCIVIDTKKGHKRLNAEESKVATRFGYTPENLEMLRASRQNIKETRIWVLRPDYVLQTAGEQVIGRASRLLDFNDDSYFYADGRGVSNQDRVRGVRREVVAVGDAPKKAVPSAPQEIVAPTFEQVLAYASKRYILDKDKPEFEAGLRKLYNL